MLSIWMFLTPYFIGCYIFKTMEYKFSIFKSIYDNEVPYTVTLDKVISRIKNGASKDKILLHRKGQQKKELLPAIVFGGIFTRRSIKDLVEHSGLMVIDIDKLESTKKAKEYKKELQNNKHFLALFISPGGKGIKGVVKIPKCTPSEHSKYYKMFGDEFKIKNYDYATSNVDRTCFESYDPEIYVNKESVIYEPKIIDEGYLATERTPVLPVTDEDEIMRKIYEFNWSSSYVKGQRNTHVFALAGLFCEYGVSKMNASNFILGNVALDDMSEHEINTAIDSAYKRRQPGIKYFEDYTKIKKVQKDLKYDKTEVIEKHKIDEETYEKINDTNESKEFWYYDKNKRVKIDHFNFKRFLESAGFRKYYPNEVLTPQFVQVVSNKVRNTSTEMIKDYVLNYLLEVNEFDVWQFCVNYSTIFSDKYLNMLETINLSMLNDTKDTTYIYFNNGVVTVDKDNVKLLDYVDVDGYIWSSSIIQRDFELTSKYNNEYQQFISNISHNDPTAIECVIGYLISTYKNKMNNKAIILNDEVISENPEGGTGKGLFIQGIKQIRRTAILDGKSFNDKKSFPYQTVSQDTSVLVFDDVKKNFDFESKFSLVTEGLTLERKNKDAIKLTVEESPKLVISTNYAIKGEGNSHNRRRHEIEIAQYYNGDRTPYSEFGRQLFDDWSKEDFIKFDNYIMSCVQLYLKIGLPQQNSKNLKLRKFVAESSMEFYEWVQDSDNVPFDVRLDKVEVFEAFVNEYVDYKKYLSRKKFNIWLQKWARYNNLEYKQGNTNGKRWFTILTENNDIDDIETKDEFPF